MVMSDMQMFCTGTSKMPDGSTLVNGGSNADASVIYYSTTESFVMGPPMVTPRAYQADVVTTTGKAFSIGGSWRGGQGNKDGEMYSPGGSWVPLPLALGNAVGGILVNGQTVPSPDMGGIYRSDNHAWLAAFQDVNGVNWVAHLGPVTMMHIFNIDNKGMMYEKGYRGMDVYSINGPCVQFSPGLFLKVGGAPTYGIAYNTAQVPPPAYEVATSAAVLIDIRALPADPIGNNIQVTILPNMTYPRAFANGVVLPGGKVFIAGGQHQVAIFSDKFGVVYNEIFDPATNTFTVINTPMQYKRNYHSVALLQPDARVLIAGGGLCAVTTPACIQTLTAGTLSNVHFNGEIFTPDYLHTGNPRPVIVSINPSTPDVINNNVFNIITTGCGTSCSFELIRQAATTHTVNNDQMRVPLAIISSSKDSYVLHVPDSSIPFFVGGYFMVFAISSSGVPSVASIIQVLRGKCATGMYSLDGGVICTACPVGSYSTIVGATACIPCAYGTSTSGYAGATHASDCVPIVCPAGSYLFNGQCSLCPAGSYTAVKGSTACTPCALSHYTNSAGATVCKTCPTGTSTTTTGCSSCTVCNHGYYAATTNPLHCNICPAGSYTYNAYTACVLCPTGTYSPSPGATSLKQCVTCPSGSTTTTKGSTACTPLHRRLNGPAE